MKMIALLLTLLGCSTLHGADAPLPDLGKCSSIVDKKRILRLNIGGTLYGIVYKKRQSAAIIEQYIYYKKKPGRGASSPVAEGIIHLALQPKSPDSVSRVVATTKPIPSIRTLYKQLIRSLAKKALTFIPVPAEIKELYQVFSRSPRLLSLAHLSILLGWYLDAVERDEEPSPASTPCSSPVAPSTDTGHPAAGAGHT